MGHNDYDNSKYSTMSTMLLDPTQFDYSQSAEEMLNIDYISPHKIKEHLDNYVIGQDDCKKLISVAVWNRLMKLHNAHSDRHGDEWYFDKTNIMMIGETGSGKTYMLKILSELIGLPVSIQDASSFTAVGWQGRDINEIFIDLVCQAHRTIKSKYDYDLLTKNQKDGLIKLYVEHSIVFLDEIDKIKETGGNGNGRDINGRAVQEGLLKVIEGTIINLSHISKSVDRDVVLPYRGEIDTTNMLFICGGAFSGLDKIVSKRVNSVNVGFTSTITNKSDNVLKNVSVKDLIQFGMIPEFLGRVGNIAVLDKITKKMLRSILLEPNRGIIRQVLNQFKSYGVIAKFAPETIDYFIDKAYELKLGARALRIVVEMSLNDLQFDAPSKYLNQELYITKDLLNEIQ